MHGQLRRLQARARRDPAGAAAATSWRATLKRLSMFVLRAKAKLSDASGRVRALRPGRHRAGRQRRRRRRAPWARAAQSARRSVVSALSGRRPAARAVGRARRQRRAARAPRSTRRLWLWGEVRSGIATITAPIVEAFVPQMLNYESVGGVNFKKGCYPGQEIVARSQFRGTLKRRAYLAQAEATVAGRPGSLPGSDPAQPCGTVAQAAPAPGRRLGGADLDPDRGDRRRRTACAGRRRAGADGGAAALPAARGHLRCRATSPSFAASVR